MEDGARKEILKLGGGDGGVWGVLRATGERVIHNSSQVGRTGSGSWPVNSMATIYQMSASTRGGKGYLECYDDDDGNTSSNKKHMVMPGR